SMQDLADALTDYLTPRQQPQVAPPQQRQPQPPRGRKRWVAVAAGLLLVATLIAGGIIFYINTSQGPIKIEIDDRNAIVLVDGEEVRIENLGDPITLKPGKHGLVIKRGDVVVETREFNVMRGDNPVLKISLPAVATGQGPTVAKGRLAALVIGVN